MTRQMTDMWSDFLNATSKARRAYNNWVAGQAVAVPQQDRIAIRYGDWTVYPDRDYTNLDKSVYNNITEWIRYLRIDLSKQPENNADENYDTDGVAGFLNGIEVVKD